ncbi:Secreted RxLR effector peptide protein [Phytophthora palmivora]|uniref:Secreted RxLR effector peptide protein n=1 Tax=Phytophthora palmivora TaxID=4796 RepID=A0A2P4Y789_9STRA|nr:Secreted RxLR effector peptide protein [Phytophthora palmivora]
MRVCYFLLATTAAFLANNAIVSAKPDDTKLSNAANSPKRYLRSQILFTEWPEKLEEFVEHHHHVREVFTRWCLEDHEDSKNKLEDTREEREEDTREEREEDTREKRDPTLEAIYNKYMSKKGEHGRKLAIIECNV